MGGPGYYSTKAKLGTGNTDKYSKRTGYTVNQPEYIMYRSGNCSSISCCSGVMGFIFFAGMPAYKRPDSQMVFSKTTAPAAMITNSSTIAWSITMAPMPISTLSFNV